MADAASQAFLRKYSERKMSQHKGFISKRLRSIKRMSPSMKPTA